VIENIIDYMEELKAMTIKKLCTIVFLSVPLTGIIKFIETYVYNDWSFLISLFILIALDTATGLIKAVVMKNFQSAKIGKIAVKITLYGIALICIHVLTNFTVNGEHPPLIGWFDDFAFSLLMLREGVSVLENIAIIKPDLLPKKLLTYLKEFDNETGEYKDGKEA
jgi:phage-related holin